LIKPIFFGKIYKIKLNVQHIRVVLEYPVYLWRCMCGRSSRLEHSTTGHYQRSAACSMHIFSHVPTYWLIFPEYEQRELYGALVVTLAVLLRLINCRFIIIIVITVLIW